MSEKSQEFRGSLVSEIGPIRLCSISPEAKDLLDTIMLEWEQHKEQLPERLECGDEAWNPRESIYGFAYWLVRWSGLVRPA